MALVLALAGGALMPARAACPAGSVLEALTPDAGWARVGSVFSDTLYDPYLQAGNTTHQPRQQQVRVSLNGQPVSGCEVLWQPQGGGGPGAHGWAFPDAPATGADGIARAWWTAGSAPVQGLEASLRRTDGTRAAVMLWGQAYRHFTRANSIHVTWRTPAWQKFSAEVTPHSWPPTTFYQVLGFRNGYGGIQSHQLLFSLWDLDGVSPQVVDPGISQCGPFDGEGTGIKCEAPYTPRVGLSYRFELELADTGDGRQDYSMYFTDPDDGQRRKLATLRLPGRLAQSGGYGFVEDWFTEADSCLAHPVRAATYGPVRYQGADGRWVTVRQAEGTAVYTPDHNEVCANYRFDDAGDGRFRLSTGGLDAGTPLNLPGGPERVTLP